MYFYWGQPIVLHSLLSCDFLVQNFHFGCCCLPALLSFTNILDIPGNLSPVFAVWKKCSEENENRTELDQDPMQPRMLSLAAEREACRSMFNTWAGFSCSLQTIYSLGVISASCPALLSSSSLSCAGCWLLSHVGSAMPGHVYTHEKKAPQLCPEPRSYQLWCFFSKALFSLGREEWGDFPELHFHLIFFFFKGNFNEKFYLWNWGWNEMFWGCFFHSALIASLLLSLTRLLSYSSSSSYSCVFHLEVTLNFSRMLA